MTDVNRPSILHVSQLSKTFVDKPVLRAIELEVGPGELVGLIGPNGAGKTTLIRCLSGQLVIDAGTVALGGVDLESNPVQAKRALGYAFEPDVLPDQLTGWQLLELVASAKSLRGWDTEVRELSQLLDMSEHIGRDIAAYSTGMRQKVGIIAALIGAPQVIVLDEPLNSLDPVSSYRVKQHLVERVHGRSTAVLMSSHLVGSLDKVCTRVIIMNEGKIIEDWTREELELRKRNSGRDLEELFIELVTPET